MGKKDFSENTRYVVTLRDPGSGRLRPANIYVYRLHDDFMIARRTDGEGLLTKIPYEDVIRIVKAVPASGAQRFVLPDALLAEDIWRERNDLQLYSSSPALGK